MMATCRLASSGPSTVGHNWTIFHSSAGPALAVRDGAVMYASTGPAPGRRGMLTGRVVDSTKRRYQVLIKTLNSALQQQLQLSLSMTIND